MQNSLAMKRFLAVLVSLVSLFVLQPSAASATTLDCSALGKYEWAQFGVDEPMYPGYEISLGVSSSAYQEPFVVHGFGTQQTVHAFFQPPTMRVPNNVAPGNHYLWVEQCGRKVAEFHAYVNHLQPWALASTWYASAGETIAWNGFMFMPGERVRLFADGQYTGISAEALSTYAPKHGVNLQGLIAYKILTYKIPQSDRGKNVLFELRGEAPERFAQTRIGVAS